VTIVGAISPPGGDLTEPVTRHTGRHTRCFWTLDKTMAQARRFPAVSFADSYSDRADEFDGWWLRETGAAWAALRRDALALIEEAAQLDQTARLIGTSSLPERQQVILAMAALFEDSFLRQGAGGDPDEWCAPARLVGLLDLLGRVARAGCAAADAGVAASEILALPSLPAIRAARGATGEHAAATLRALAEQFERECAALFAARVR
jgi:V/A-type H+-transporting ATPase subunit A